MASCCNFVGNLTDLKGLGCIISYSYNSRTDVVEVQTSETGTSETGDEKDYLVGPTIANINITGYVQNSDSLSVYVGCPAKGGVSIPWQQRIECLDVGHTVHFICLGEGNSYSVGTLPSEYAKVKKSVNSFDSLNADASSGPYNFYTKDTQIDGYGFEYFGGPIGFDTESVGVKFSGDLGFGTKDHYLQQFEVSFVPGQVPVASYSFVVQIDNSVLSLGV